MDPAKKHFIEWSKYYKNDRRSWFYEALQRFEILCNRYCLVFLLLIYIITLYYIILYYTLYYIILHYALTFVIYYTLIILLENQLKTIMTKKLKIHT